MFVSYTVGENDYWQIPPTRGICRTIIMDRQTVFAVAVALLMAAALIPFGMAGDSDSLTPNSNLELNEPTTVIYVAAGANHSTTYSVKTGTIPTGFSGSDVVWTLNDLDDGNCVSFSDSADVFTTTGGSVTVYGKTVGSVELVAQITGSGLTEPYVASVVVVVFSSPTANATEFHFFFKIDPAGYAYAQQQGASVTLPAGKTMADFNNGFWVTVKQSDVTGDFNALSALQWYLTQNNWSHDIASSGWINHLLGLSTYAGPGSTYHYWAQYHAEPASGNPGGTWAFNNTTLYYITSVDSSYIGLIFWGSPSSDDSPTFPGYPSA